MKIKNLWNHHLVHVRTLPQFLGDLNKIVTKQPPSDWCSGAKKSVTEKLWTCCILPPNLKHLGSHLKLTLCSFMLIQNKFERIFANKRLRECWPQNDKISVNGLSAPENGWLEYYYCWWFRNPVNSPVEVGSWNPIIYMVLYISIHAGFQPSTLVSFWVLAYFQVLLLLVSGRVVARVFALWGLVNTQGPTASHLIWRIRQFICKSSIPNWYCGQYLSYLR